MGKVYIGQDNLFVQLTANQDITGATATEIHYRTPAGTESSLTASVVSAVSGILRYTFPTGTSLSGLATTSTGVWAMWAFVTFSDGRSAAGEPVKTTIYPEGY